jgi:hypothetical protein
MQRMINGGKALVPRNGKVSFMLGITSLGLQHQVRKRMMQIKGRSWGGDSFEKIASTHLG